MATISITIPDNQLARVVEGIALACGYQETIDGQPNPQTKNQFARARVAQWVKDTVRRAELRAAEAAAAEGITDVSVS